MIERSAYLDVCSHCHGHAKIVYADGSCSAEFASIEKGYLILRESRMNGLVDEEEFSIVQDQIMDSPLRGDSGLMDHLLGTITEQVHPEMSDWLYKSKPRQFDPRLN